MVDVHTMANPKIPNTAPIARTVFGKKLAVFM